MSAIDAVPCEEGQWVEPRSGRRLSYRLWQPGYSRALLVIVHGFGKHGSRYHALAQALAQAGICVAVPDLWGHGRSGGKRGDVKDVPRCASDVARLTAQVFQPRTGHAHYALFGHSFGALVAITVALDEPRHLERLVVQSPLLAVGFPIPRWKTALAALLARAWPTCSFTMDLNVERLSHDPTIVQAYRTDPLVHNAMSVRSYGSILRAMDDVFERAGTLQIPVLFLYGTADCIVSISEAKRWFALVQAKKRSVGFPTAYHELHHEAVREEALELIRDWILNVVVALGLVILLTAPAISGEPAHGDGSAKTDAQASTDWPTVIARLRQQMYERPGHGPTREQLATAYNNYGVALGDQHQWELAVQQLEEAIKLDADQEQFRNNLSLVYVNQAQEAYERFQVNGALEALSKATVANPNLPQAYVLRGQIEYDRQKLKEAKAAWQRAIELDPAQTELAKRLAQVTQELPVESKFEKLSHGYFDVRYEEPLERPLGFDVRDALLEARRLVGADFAYWPKHKIVVLIYSAESFRALRKETPDWAAGQFDGKIRVPLPDAQMDQATVRQILFHEYTHALIHDLTNRQCPLWLNEGLAEHEGRTQLAGTLHRLRQAFEGRQLIPWIELSDHFSSAQPAQDVAMAYEQSYSLSAFLIQRYGLWKIRRLLKAIADGQPWDAALEKEFRAKLTKIEAAWRAWLPEWLRTAP
ncbi:MAG: alpha/beta fold hydrolase [Candidatus Omnitrophica bacterium]|nr:alpha/beta fold hydrolase [Candidatus Omnitrophota bacterium]